jgi:hypothetical protein
LLEVALTHDPLRRAFKQQKAGAKHRGIPWRLEHWEWLQIWQDSGPGEWNGNHNDRAFPMVGVPA